MKMKATTIIIFLLQFLIIKVFSSVRIKSTNYSHSDNGEYKNFCERNTTENNASKEILLLKCFIQDLILQHLRHCYIVQIHNDQKTFRFDQHFSEKIATLDINLLEPTLKLHHLTPTKKERRNTIRFQDQCIVYYVIFLQDKTFSNLHMLRLEKIFLHQPFQAQAHQSYIFIHNHNNDENDDQMAQKIVLSPALKNYKHKAWIKIYNNGLDKKNLLDKDEIKSKSTNFKFKINHFCYFCQNGYPGILRREEEGQIIDGSVDIKHLQQIFPDVTSNLYGRPLRVTAAMALPFVGILSSPNATNKLRIEGMQATVLKCLASSMNFTFILENTSGGLTGSKLSNNSWTGTIGEVLNERSDMGLNAATTQDRHEIVDFTVPAYYGFLVLVSTKPSPVFEWKAIFYPFKMTAWLGICLSTLITISAYRFFLNCAVIKPPSKKYDGKQQNEQSKGSVSTKKEDGPRKVSFFKVCYMTIGSLLEQGVPFNYFSAPSRIYALFWLVFTIVATCAYKSKLFSYLTCPISQTPPSTFHELSVSSYSWGLKSLGGVAFLFLTKSPLSYIRVVGEKMEISMDKYSCLDKTFSEDFVCIIYRAYYDYMSAVRYWKIVHKFYVSDYVTPPVGSSFVIPKYSPLLPVLDKNIYLQFEMGLAGIYLEHYIKEMALKSRAAAQASNDTKDLFDLNTKFQRKTMKEKPLEFGNLYVGFLALFFGMGISTVVFIVEHWRRKHGVMEKFSNGETKNLKRVRILYGLHFMRPKQQHKQKQQQQQRCNTSKVKIEER